MDNAPLVFRLWKGSGYCLLNPCQSIGTEDQDVFYSTVFLTVQNGKPVLGTLIFANLDGQNFF